MQRLVTIVAVLFGLATLVAGARVLAGSDPGYVVHRPLLIYNTAMGVAYVAAGIVAWIDARRGMHAAAAIFVLNGLALAAVGYLYAQKAGVAIESLRAMTFRTGVWLVLWLALAWLARRKRAGEPR